MTMVLICSSMVRKGKLFLAQYHSAALDAAHIQNVVDEAEQVPGALADLFQILSGFLVHSLFSFISARTCFSDTLFSRTICRIIPAARFSSFFVYIVLPPHIIK